jgi:hypothetical protein
MSNFRMYQRGQTLINEANKLIGMIHRKGEPQGQLAEMEEELIALKHRVHLAIIDSLPDPPQTVLAKLAQINATFNKN